MTNKIYIGLDPSFTGTGIWTSEGEQLLIKTKNDRCTEQRIIDIWTKMYSEIISPYVCAKESAEDFEVIIGIEGFSFMSKGRSISQLFGLGWILRTKLYQLTKDSDVKIYEIPPHSWKKLLFNGKVPKGSKNLTLLETYKRFQQDIRDDNLCDAYNIMRYTRELDNYVNGKTEDMAQWKQDLFKKTMENEAKRMARKS